MTFEIITLPCRADNYAFVLHNSETGQTAVVDAPETAPILALLNDRGWTLDDLLLTHHHDDHIDATEDLRAAFGCRVIGATADAHRLPSLDLAIKDGDHFETCGHRVDVLDVSGHTVGHIAFHIASASAAFTADSLMALGCGRLFEGSPAQMWESLKKLRALPENTIVYSGHEYTVSNAKFALTIEPDNSELISRVQTITAMRAKGRPTVPSTLAEEIATNPFLRADHPALAAAIGLQGSTPTEIFTAVRKRKDNF